MAFDAQDSEDEDEMLRRAIAVSLEEGLGSGLEEDLEMDNKKGGLKVKVQTKSFIFLGNFRCQRSGAWP